MFPMVTVSHKSRKFSAILDLSFKLHLTNGSIVPPVNGDTEKTSPHGTVNQLDHSLLREVHAFTKVDNPEEIYLAK